jgi:hypothetical protein
MFTKLYLETTNPKLTLSGLLSPRIMIGIFDSVLFHTIVYVLFCNVGSWIFFGKVLSKEINARLAIALTIIMVLGYIGRLLHTREIYRAYDGDIEKTRKYIDDHYISWVFLS